MCLAHSIGAFKHHPEDITKLTNQARDLVKRAFDDIDPAQLLDYHTHVAGIRTGANGTFVNPKMRSWVIWHRALARRTKQRTAASMRMDASCAP